MNYNRRGGIHVKEKYVENERGPNCPGVQPGHRARAEYCRESTPDQLSAPYAPARLSDAPSLSLALPGNRPDGFPGDETRNPDARKSQADE